MPELSMDAAIAQVLAVLAEALEGPKQSWSYFTDQGAEAGIFGTLSRLSAADASRVWGGTTIAAHAHHARFAFAASAAWISGDHSSRDWSESWSVSTVDAAAWKRLQQDLRASSDELRRAIESHAASSTESFGGALAAVAHAAYHLGAMRQKVVTAAAAVRASG